MRGSDLHHAGRKSRTASRLAALVGGATQGRRPRRHRWLDPVQRAGEIACGLLVTILFTGTFAVLGSDARTMGLSAVSAAAAWATVCAALYVRRDAMAESRRQRLQAELLQAPTAEAFIQRLGDELPASLLGDLPSHELHRMKSAVREAAQEAPDRRSQWLGALAVLLLVFLGTLPAALPLLWSGDAATGLRFAHGIAVALLFALGGFLGHHARLRPVLLGACLAAAGALLSVLSWLLRS